jgi:hypothetical protein
VKSLDPRVPSRELDVKSNNLYKLFGRYSEIQSIAEITEHLQEKKEVRYYLNKPNKSNFKPSM